MADKLPDEVRVHQVVLVVCHPDDEALWIGGLLHALSAFECVNVSVICLSGDDPCSPRVQEFHQAQIVAGYKQGVVLGGALRNAMDPLPDIGDTLEQGLIALNIPLHSISLLITHSPYGDEHMHPHHMQAAEELARWTQCKDIPYGYFSCLPMPHCALYPRLRAYVRKDECFLLQGFFECRYSFSHNLLKYLLRNSYLFPKYFLQFVTDGNAKQKMLGCYKSIDLPAHENGYGMFINNVECIYLMDYRALIPFSKVMNEMEIVGVDNLFPPLWWIGIRARKMLSQWRRVFQSKWR